ncbi:hypothetical protein [uncultured Methylobacterium sp.]|uniref:hypothetical protein n=1 Tax=uncultured Methylobacterium sp. TaxID=157278 RepID=UPI00258B1905|nr:hypothetical protein [uncultured Methylobacterium sp.]
MINQPAGCRFHIRCPHAFDRNRVEESRLDRVGVDHSTACHLNDIAAPIQVA